MADQTTSSIVIDAPAADIMAVIADLERYPEWSAGVKNVTVLSTVEDGSGRPATARFTIDMSGIKDSYNLVYDWQGDAEVSWKLLEGSVLKAMDGTYRLTEQGTSTKVDYLLAVDVSIPMIGLMRRKAEKIIVDTALKGLKKRVTG